jgi:hypothetical protein
VIIKDITPATYLLPDDPAVSDWKEIALTLKHGDYKTAQSVHETLAEPIGEWEIYLGRSFLRQVFRSKIEGSTKLLFDLKYRSHLRLFANRRAFDTRLRAYLGNRLAHWEAVACRRLAERPSATRVVEQKLPIKKRGRPGKFTDQQIIEARAAKSAGKTNNAVAKILYKTLAPTPQQRHSVPTLLRYHRKIPIEK